MPIRNYHVVLKDGSERNVKANKVEVLEDGALGFQTTDALVCLYAKDTWAMVEVERLDDKG